MLILKKMSQTKMIKNWLIKEMQGYSNKRMSCFMTRHKIF